MEDQTNYLTVRQTFVLSWDATTQWYKESVEDLDSDTDSSSNPPTGPGGDCSHQPDVRIPITKAWDARARRWTVTPTTTWSTNAEID